MKSISGAEATGQGRGNCLNRFPTKPGQSGWGVEDISCSQPIQCLRLPRWGGGQSEFACDCTRSKIYCLDLELQRIVVSPHVSSTVVSPQVGQITNTLVPVPTNFDTGRTLMPNRPHYRIMLIRLRSLHSVSQK